MDNLQAASQLALYAELIELEEDEPFKARAYLNAARVLRGLEEPARDLLADGRLARLPGFGKGIITALKELYSTGKVAEIEAALGRLPVALRQLRRVPGLGAKRVRTLYREHGIDSLEALKRAIEEGRLASLRGYGEKSVSRIREGIDQVERFLGRLRLPQAESIDDAVREIISVCHPECDVVASGALRRRMEIVDALVWIVDASRPDDQLVPRLRTWSQCVGVQTQADRLLPEFADGVRGEIRFVAGAFGRALLETTGPHSYAEFVLKTASGAGASETEIVRSANLPELPPECRDLECLWHRGAPADLLEPSDLRGVLHCHTVYSDGLASLQAMAGAALERGLTYLGVCDHSRSAAYAGGLSVERIAAQHAEIDRLNAEWAGAFRIFKGIESDIRPDGSLDYPEDVLDSFDFVVASIHSGLDMDARTATERICRAIAHPHTTMLGHPTGRLLLQRRGYELDWERVIDAAARHDVTIELNAHPRRLDVDWRHLPAMFGAGVRTSINPDAHSTDGIDDMRYGVGAARKAGTTPKHVLNCLEADDLARYFEKRHP